MKVIHFITDEKHLNNTIDFFEDIKELENRYILVTYDETPFNYLDSNKIERVPITDIKRIISKPNLCDVIVLHNLTSLPCKFIKDINDDIKVVWFSWGFDIYENVYPQFKLIPLKNQIKHKSYPLRYRLRILNEKRRLLFKKKDNNTKQERTNFIKAIHRIDYYSGVLSIEWNFLNNNSFFKAKQIQFNYPPQKDVYTESILFKDLRPKGNNILVGNSGNDLGNHGNSFWILSNLNLHDKKIVVPLSYGGNSLYRSIVNKMGIKYFGNHFIALDSFISESDYYAYLQSFAVTIFNIKRQAAVGNIINSFWNGAKVFLPEDSICYKHFKSQGYHVFSIEKDLNQKEIDSLLSDEMIIDNRKKIIKYHSYEAIKEKTTNSFRQIANDLNIPFSASPIS